MDVHFVKYIGAESTAIGPNSKLAKNYIIKSFSPNLILKIEIIFEYHQLNYVGENLKKLTLNQISIQKCLRKF